MTVRKRILAEGRVRRPPTEGWSWIDRRFLRDHAPSVSREAILLYFFLAAVSDKHGLSYYGDTAISSRLRLEEVVIADARDELEARLFHQAEIGYKGRYTHQRAFCPIPG